MRCVHATHISGALQRRLWRPAPHTGDGRAPAHCAHTLLPTPEPVARSAAQNSEVTAAASAAVYCSYRHVRSRAEFAGFEWPRVPASMRYPANLEET